MATNKSIIKEWLEEAKEQNATHLIVVCDTFDYEDYPVFVSKKEDVHEVAAEYKGAMQLVMEVYSLKRSIAAQLKEYRAFHYD